MLNTWRLRSVLLAGFLSQVLCSIGCVDRHTGPWDLHSLAEVPAVEWIDSTGTVRGLYYAGELYGGKPTRVFAYYAVPEDVCGKVPAMVLVHGGGGKAFKEWAELWAQRGYAAIAMDLAGRGPDGQRLPDGGPDQHTTDKFHRIAQGLKEAWPYHAVTNVIRAHSLLRTFPQVDPERIGLTGISWGGYLTCIVAGLDHRFKAAVPVYGCGFLDTNKYSRWIKIFDSMPQANRKLWIDTYDPSCYLPGCRIPILFINGTNDIAFPLDIYQKSYRLVKGPRRLCVTVGMPHSHPAGWAPKEIGIFVDSMLKGGKPLARFEQVSRQGQKVCATLEAEVPITKAALHYTTDYGLWEERQWQTIPTDVDHDRVSATLPNEKGIVYFFTVTDERGAIVSTEHEELAPVWEITDDGWAYLPASRDFNVKQAMVENPPTGSKEIVIKPPLPKRESVVSVTNFGIVADGPQGPAVEADGNYEALMRAISHCRDHKASKLIVPAGVYRITSPNPIVFEELDNFIFDGGGAEFIFSQIGKGMGFVIDRCRRCVFRDFKVDWDWDLQPLASVGRVVDVAEDRSYFDMKFPDEKEVDENKFRCRAINALDEKTLLPGAGKDFVGIDPEKVLKIETKVLRVWPKWPLKVEPGELYRVRHFMYDKHAFHLASNVHLRLEDVVIYSFPGVGYDISGDQHHWELIDCKITHRPNKWRPITCTTDGYHVVQSQGYMRMEGCEFGYMGDDCVNIHDVCSQGVTVADKHTVVAENVISPRNLFQAGDTVELRKGDFSPMGFRSKLTAAEYDEIRSECRLSFADELPAGVPSDAIVLNRRYHSSNFVIRNCYFHENRANGLLIQSPGGLIENNRFYRHQQTAINVKIGCEPNWAEGYGPGNLIFRNNTFEKVNPMSARDGIVIDVRAFLPMGQTPYPVFQNILFEDNTFIDFPGPAIFLSSCKNVIVRNNTFRNPSKLPAGHTNRGLIRAERASDLKFIENKWEPSPYVPRAGVEFDPNSVRNFVTACNALIDK
ncbi:MAG: alpha/beta fold hydrolase [Planctomycetota bacterium]